MKICKPHMLIHPPVPKQYGSFMEATMCSYNKAVEQC